MFICRNEHYHYIKFDVRSLRCALACLCACMNMYVVDGRDEYVYGAFVFVT